MTEQEAENLVNEFGAALVLACMFPELPYGEVNHRCQQAVAAKKTLISALSSKAGEGK